MKKILILLVIVGIVLILKTPVVKDAPSYKETYIPSAKEVAPTKTVTRADLGEETDSIFVPDWNLSEETILHNGYTRWIYFGGKEKLPLFKSVLKDKNLWLTLRASTIEELEKANLSEYDLERIEGVVLDLEINGLATKDFVSQISGEIERLKMQADQKGIKLSVAMYGDLFYRKRPYDLKKINDLVSEVMVMTYDYHKTYGEPGENYPYEEFKKMVDNYLAIVPAEKLTIIFGMYGYDWTLKDGKPLRPAEALSLFEIRNRFMKKVCLETACKVTTDDTTKEKKVTYKDDDGYDHVVHFEDEDSVEVKKQYLKEKGITSMSFWAWGYF
jgi:spore germination protein YaaH